MPVPPMPVASMPEGAPNRTLYVTNLNDKLHKDDLKRCLYMLFATYGVVLDIVALKTMKMRGQAHIVFRDIDAATQAMRALQSFNFFGKDMRIAYAKSKSDTIAKLDGTFKLPEPEKPHQEESKDAAPAYAPAPERAVPVNDATKGQKRSREEEEEEEEDDDDAAMDMSDDESD